MRLDIDPTILERFCGQHHIRRLALFGSQLSGTADAQSDIDLLVEFEPDHVPGLIGLAGMELELSRLLGGKPVDLRTAQDLSHHFRDEILNTEIVRTRGGDSETNLPSSPRLSPSLPHQVVEVPP
ncbi:MAG: nucleotidyltransferase domain-containing protein [Chromatiaceae bacterium]|jgi:hypothetical protein|nr:nucleotidyltransferase domain-containing protein [Candidatus Thioaporhodococcus sediminis]